MLAWLCDSSCHCIRPMLSQQPGSHHVCSGSALLLWHAVFKDYPRLVMWRRRELVQSGVSVVDGVRQLHLTLHPPRHLGDPTPGLPAQHPWPAQMARQPAANGTPAHAAEAVAPQQPNVAVKRVSEPQQAGLGQVRCLMWLSMWAASRAAKGSRSASSS